DEYYEIDDLDKVIQSTTQELMDDNQLNNSLEEGIDQSDFEKCDDNSDSETPRRRIEQMNTPYLQETQKKEGTQNEHLYSASANEIDEKRPELKDLHTHLEYAYLKGDESYSMIISYKLTEKEKVSLLRVLEKQKGVIAWKMSDIKGINSSFCTHKILMEESFKPSLFVSFDSYVISKDKISRDVLTIGSTMRIPLLFRGEYLQWSERFINYLEEQKDGKAMINLIKNGDQPLPTITQVSIAGATSSEQPSLKDKSMWSDQEKKIRKIDRLARSLLIQELPNDIYSLIDSNKTAKDL
nr:reverse transcriptase domain-containing protein [Tanacetum cinerariifolium]